MGKRSNEQYRIVTETTVIHFITQKYCGYHYLQSAIYLTFRSTVEKVHETNQPREYHFHSLK